MQSTKHQLMSELVDQDQLSQERQMWLEDLKNFMKE
jgi:hypothetical protein